MAGAAGEETREKERLTCLAVGRTREDRTGGSRDEEKALNKMQPSFMGQNHHHPENVPKLSQSGSVKPYDSSHTRSTSHCHRHEEETRRLQTRKGDTRQPGGRCCGLSVRKLPNDLRESPRTRGCIRRGHRTVAVCSAVLWPRHRPVEPNVGISNAVDSGSEKPCA